MKRVAGGCSFWNTNQLRSAVFPCEDNKHAHGPSKKWVLVGKTSFAMPDVDPTLPTPLTINRPAMNTKSAGRPWLAPAALQVGHFEQNCLISVQN
jgi:hypothetical protein